MTQTTKYIILTLLTFVVGFFFLHTAYFASSENPYAQEIILIVLGTIATILITAALLNKQSELELEKEHHIKIFELKSSIYLELIDFLEKIVTKGKITDNELVYIEYLTHKISIVASAEVLQEYSSFIDVLKNASNDQIISATDSDKISMALAKLTVKIRLDLLQNDENDIDLEKLIVKNVNRF